MRTYESGRVRELSHGFTGTTRPKSSKSLCGRVRLRDWSEKVCDYLEIEWVQGHRASASYADQWMFARNESRIEKAISIDSNSIFRASAPLTALTVIAQSRLPIRIQ